jgi:hypothetical protein
MSSDFERGYAAGQRDAKERNAELEQESRDKEDALHVFMIATARRVAELEQQLREAEERK